MIACPPRGPHRAHAPLHPTFPFLAMSWHLLRGGVRWLHGGLSPRRSRDVAPTEGHVRHSRVPLRAASRPPHRAMARQLPFQRVWTVSRGDGGRGRVVRRVPLGAGRLQVLRTGIKMETVSAAQARPVPGGTPGSPRRCGRGRPAPRSKTRGRREGPRAGRPRRPRWSWVVSFALRRSLCLWR